MYLVFFLQGPRVAWSLPRRKPEKERDRTRDWFLISSCWVGYVTATTFLDPFYTLLLRRRLRSVWVLVSRRFDFLLCFSDNDVYLSSFRTTPLFPSVVPTFFRSFPSPSSSLSTSAFPPHLFFYFYYPVRATEYGH